MCDMALFYRFTYLTMCDQVLLLLLPVAAEEDGEEGLGGMGGKASVVAYNCNLSGY